MPEEPLVPQRIKALCPIGQVISRPQKRTRQGLTQILDSEPIEMPINPQDIQQ
jgi:hypothetical protein